MTEPHIYSFRVSYGDSDAAGVLYYARYLNYSEKARLEWINSMGYNWKELHISDKVIFPVREVKIIYKKPIFLGDRSCIYTLLKKVDHYNLRIEQKFFNEKQELCTSCWIKIVCLENNKLVPIKNTF